MSAENTIVITSQGAHEFSGRGKIYSHTTVYESKYVPERFKDFVPYSTAIIRLEEGPLTTAQLTDLDPDHPIEIGMPVEWVTRKLFSEGEYGMIVYGTKFRPPLRDSS